MGWRSRVAATYETVRQVATVSANRMVSNLEVAICWFSGTKERQILGNVRNFRLSSAYYRLERGTMFHMNFRGFSNVNGTMRRMDQPFVNSFATHRGSGSLCVRDVTNAFTHVVMYVSRLNVTKR